MVYFVDKDGNTVGGNTEQVVDENKAEAYMGPPRVVEQFPTLDVKSTVSWMWTLFSFALLVVIIYMAWWAWKRYVPNNSARMGMRHGMNHNSMNMNRAASSGSNSGGKQRFGFRFY